MMPRYHNGIEVGVGTPTVPIMYVPEKMLVHTNSQGRPFYFVSSNNEIRMADTGEYLIVDPARLKLYKNYEGERVRYWSIFGRPKGCPRNVKRVIELT